jgi:hypothetical protein
MGSEDSFRALFHRRCLAVIYLQTWRKKSAEVDTIVIPAVKTLRDLDRFSKSTYPIDAKLVDGQLATAPNDREAQEA